MSRGSPICKISPAHPPTSREQVLPTDRPAVNWVTAVSGLFGSDLIASGSSSGHVQLWRLVIEGKAFSFGGAANEEDGDGDEGESGRRTGGRLKVHHDTTRIERIPNAEFNLVSLVSSLGPEICYDTQWSRYEFA